MPTTPAQDEFLAITRKSQEAVVAAVKTWVETVKAATPRLSPLTDKLPKMPSFSMPLTDRLPGREETVASAYRLAEQVLANQRKFAEDLLKLMTPLIPGQGESAPGGPAAKSKPASPAAKSKPASPAAKSKPASPAAKSKPASPAAESPPAAPAPKAAPAKSRTPKSTPARSAAKSTTAKGAPRNAAARPARKGPAAS